MRLLGSQLDWPLIFQAGRLLCVVSRHASPHCIAHGCKIALQIGSRLLLDKQDAAGDVMSSWSAISSLHEVRPPGKCTSAFCMCPRLASVHRVSPEVQEEIMQSFRCHIPKLGDSSSGPVGSIE